MKHQHTSTEIPITIDRPMVIIPAEEYKTLLKEAGYKPTPLLNRTIAEARARFRKGKFLKWEKFKHDLL